MRHVLVFLVLLACWADTLQAATRYVSPAGTTGDSTTCSNAAPCTLQQALALAGPGDVINMKDGTYTGSSSMLLPPDNVAGTSGNPITVQAINEGNVLISGQGSRIPVRLDTGNHWWIIQGINACCSSTDVVTSGPGSTNNIFRRIVAWDASNTINAGVYNAYQTTNALFEDIVAFGTGSKVFARIHDTNTIVLRSFVMHNGHKNGGQNHTFAYDTVNSHVYNHIGTMDLYVGSGPMVHLGLGSDHYNSYGLSPRTIVHELKGSIGYHVEGQRLNNTFYCMTPQMPEQAVSVYNDANPGNTIDVTTIADNILCMSRTSKTPTNPPGTGAPFYGVFFGGTGAHTHTTNDHWTYSLGATPSGAVNQTENSSNLTYASFQNGLLNLDAATQPTQGAWLRYRYNANGTLSSTPLWPWPMDDRIEAAISSTPYAARGLDGKGTKRLTPVIMALAGSTLGGTATPLHFAYVTQPQASVVEDAPIIGYKVCVYDASNVIQLDYTANFNSSFGVNPGGTAVLGGNKSLAPTNGCATFNGITIDQAGVGYTIRITSGATTAAESTPITVTAAPGPVAPSSALRIRNVPTPQ